MIATNEIAQMIKQPDLIKSTDTDELSQLCQKHPFAQIFPILLLKGLANSKSVNFESELVKQSYKISNRSQLYNLIHQFDTEEIADHTELTIEKEEPVEVATSDIETVDETPAPLVETEEEVIQSIKEEASTPVENEDSVTESEESEIVPEQSDPLEESILHSAFISNYKLDDLSVEEEEKLQEKTEESIEVGLEFNARENKDNSDTLEEHSSFISWLHADQNYQEEDTSEKEAINSVVNDFKDFDPLSTLSGEVEKPKVEFFSPTKKAKESLDEATLPVSETLAKIYYLQGNYPKAIEAYQQLSLKFPEKKIFFANLIEDLEKKLKT